MKIFLVGFMGSGKSSIGKRLAELIGFNFIDTDHFIEDKYNLSVEQIFAELGEDEFRKAEHNVLNETEHLNYTVIATGGGMPCFNDNMNNMLKQGNVVYLKTSPKTLVTRLAYSRTKRPLIEGMSKKELQEYVEKRLEEREPFYNMANVTMRTERFSMDALLQALNLMK